MELSKAITFRISKKDLDLITKEAKSLKKRAHLSISKGDFIRSSLSTFSVYNEEFIKEKWIKYMLNKKNTHNKVIGLKTFTVRIDETDMEFIDKYVNYAKKNLGFFVSRGDFISFCVNQCLNNNDEFMMNLLEP